MSKGTVTITSAVLTQAHMDKLIEVLKEDIANLECVRQGFVKIEEKET